MKSLGAIVRTRNLIELRRIAEVWGATSPTSEDVNEALRLERQMRELIAARTLWENLSVAARAVLAAVVGPSARNWCTVEALPDRAGITAEDAQTAISSLQAIFLLDEKMAKLQGSELIGQRTAFYSYVTARPQQEPVVEKEIVYVPTEIATTLYTIVREYHGMPSDRTTMTLDELLMPYRQGDLDQIGKRFNLMLQSYSSRNEARAIIAQNVCQANAVQYVLQQLDPPLQELYAWLIARGGRALITEVRQHMHWSVPELLQALHTFEEYAIAFDAFSDGQRVIFIPAATFDNLRRANARPRVEVGLRERAVPRAIRPADNTILWDIAALVAASAQQEIELTRAQALPKRTMQRILPLLTNDCVQQSEDAGIRYLTQLQMEAKDLGLIQLTPIEDRIRIELGEQLHHWATHDCRMQTLRILRRWMHNRNWHDRAGVNYRGWMSSFINIPAAREAIVQILRLCESGIWYDVPSLLATILDDDPFVIRPNQRFAGQGGFKMTEEVRLHWQDTDGEILVGILSSTLHELGIVSLGYDTDAVPSSRALTNPDAVMLTELGAEVLKDDLGRSYVPPERALIVQPNFEILLLEPHMPALYWLIRFTQVEQLGRASRFKMTREALLHAIGDGVTLDDILAFLRSHGQKEVSQNVIYTLNDWARQYKETHLSQVVLIEVTDEMLANELCTSTKLRDLGLRRVGPQALAAPPGKALRTVRRAIERAGYATQAQEGK